MESESDVAPLSISISFLLDLGDSQLLGDKIRVIRVQIPAEYLEFDFSRCQLRLYSSKVVDQSRRLKLDRDRHMIFLEFPGVH